MNELQPHETDLLGDWLQRGTGVVADDTALRIEWLLAERLEYLAADSSGWESLYRDPSDGRLWELTYPHGAVHGGGPPRLRVLPAEDARRKYGELTA